MNSSSSISWRSAFVSSQWPWICLNAHMYIPFRLQLSRLPTAVVFNLKALLEVWAVPEKICKNFKADVCFEVAWEPVFKARIYGFRDSWFVIECMNIACFMGNNCHTFIIKSLSGFSGKLGSIKPHGFCDKASMFVITPSPISRKFWEWSGVASIKILSRGFPEWMHLLHKVLQVKHIHRHHRGSRVCIWKLPSLLQFLFSSMEWYQMYLSSEVFSYVNIKIIFVTFVAEKSITLSKNILIDIRWKTSSSLGFVVNPQVSRSRLKVKWSIINCFIRWSRRYGLILSSFENQGSFFHSHIRGDMMFASVKAYINSGNIKTSISESVIADEYFSRDCGSDSLNINFSPAYLQLIKKIIFWFIRYWI